MNTNDNIVVSKLPKLKGKRDQHRLSGTSSSGHGQRSRESVGQLLQALTANYLVRNPPYWRMILILHRRPKELPNLPCGKASKTWKIIQECFQPKDSTSARDLTSALQKIQLKMNTNPIKILSDISVVEIRFKKTLDEERKIEVVQGCVGDNYAQVIVAADGIAWLKSGGAHNAAALELCKAMKKTAGHNDDDKKDNDNDDDNMELETLLGTVKHKQSSIHKKQCFYTAARKTTGHHFVLTRKRREGQKNLALQLMGVLRKQGPSVVTAAAQITLKMSRHMGTVGSTGLLRNLGPGFKPLRC
jgi:hypothetical protein